MDDAPSPAPAGSPRCFSPWLTALIAILGLTAVVALLFPLQAFTVAGLTAFDLAQPATSHETLHEALLIIAGSVALGSALLLALFGSIRLLREPLVLLAAVLVTLIAHALGLARIGHVPDQAFVDFVAARNLAHHGQLAFNLGDRAAGYSSLLQVLLLTPFACLPQMFDLKVVAQGLALVAAIPTISLLYVLGRRMQPDRAPAWSLLAPLLLSLYPGYLLCTATAVATQLVTLLVTAGACLYILQPRGRWWPVLFALAAVARADAIVFLLVTFVREASERWGERGAIRSLVIRCIPAAAIVAARLLWAGLYHGHLVSSAFLATGGFELSAERLGHGAYYVGSFLAQLAGVTLFLVPLAALLRRLPGALGYACVLVACGLFVIAVQGGDPLPAHGQAAVVAPLLFLLLQESASTLYTWLAGQGHGGATPLNVVLAFALLLAYPVPYFRGEARLARQLARRAQAARSLHDIGLYVGSDPKASTAIYQPGQVRWLSDKPVVDLSGRCARAVALQGADAAPHVLAMLPRYIVLTALTPNYPIRVTAAASSYRHPIEQRIATLPAFHSGYAFVRSFTHTPQSEGSRGQYLLLFKRTSNAPEP